MLPPGVVDPRLQKIVLADTHQVRDQPVEAKAHRRGTAVGAFDDTVLDGPLPWTRMRQVYALFRACDRFGDDRVNQACLRALDAECRDVKIVIGMAERALEAETADAEPVPDNVIVGRFSRDPAHFAAGREVNQ